MKFDLVHRKLCTIVLTCDVRLLGRKACEPHQADHVIGHIGTLINGYLIDFELKKVLLPPLGNFADISYLEENFKPHLLRDVCTLCSGALVSDSLLHMLL